MSHTIGGASAHPWQLSLASVAALAIVGVACAPAGQAPRASGAPPAPTAQSAVLDPGASSRQSAVVSEAGVPDFALSTIDGGTFRLSEQRGRVVGLFVMASWCATCIPETQAWERLAGERGAQALTVVAVSGDPGDTEADVQRFAALAKATHPIWTLDPKAEFVHQFQVRSLDTTLIFDRRGQLVYRDAIPTPYDVLRRELDKALL